MSTTDDPPKTEGETDERGPLECIRQSEEDVEALAELDNTVGAFARVLLALSRGESPAESDLRAAGVDDADLLMGGSE